MTTFSKITFRAALVDSFSLSSGTSAQNCMITLVKQRALFVTSPQPSTGLPIIGGHYLTNSVENNTSNQPYLQKRVMSPVKMTHRASGQDHSSSCMKPCSPVYISSDPKGLRITRFRLSVTTLLSHSDAGLVRKDSPLDSQTRLEGGILLEGHVTYY